MALVRQISLGGEFLGLIREGRSPNLVAALQDRDALGEAILQGSIGGVLNEDFALDLFKTDGAEGLL